MIGAGLAAWRIGREGVATAVVFSENAAENSTLTKEYEGHLVVLNAEQVKAIERRELGSTRLSLARMFAWFEHPAYTSEHLLPLVEQLEAYSRIPEKGILSSDTATYEADVALQAVTVAAARFDLPESDRKRLVAAAIRAAGATDDEVVRMRTAMLLKTVRDARPSGALGVDEARVLDELMKNEWNRHMVEKNWGIIEDLAAGRPVDHHKK